MEIIRQRFFTILLISSLIWFSALSARADTSSCQANGLSIGAVANWPFTAEVRVATWQLNNGNRENMRIVRIMKVARDSNGQVMVLFPQHWASDEDRDAGGEPTRWQIRICDPLKGVDTTISAKQTVDASPGDAPIGNRSVEAWISVQPVLPRSTASSQYPFDGPHLLPENYNVEDLGFGEVGDIRAHHFRWWLKADGEAPNGKFVDEAFSLDLQLVLARIVANGTGVTHGTEYVHLDRGEPDPQMFQIPATYKIISTKEIPSGR